MNGAAAAPVTADEPLLRERAARARLGRSGPYVVGLAHVLGLVLVAWLSITAEPAVLAASTRETALTPVEIAKLTGGTEVVERFRMPQGNLARIDVLVEHGDKAPDTPVIVHLRRNRAGVDTRTIELPPAALPAKGHVPIVFDALPNSAGRWYYLVIEAPGASEARAVSVLGANCDCLSVGHLIEPLPKVEDDPDGNRFTPHLRDVGMRLLYLPAEGSSSKIDIVRDRIGDYKPGWLQVRWLVAWALLASAGYAAFIGLALRLATDGFSARGAGAIYAASIVAGVLLPAMFVRLG